MPLCQAYAKLVLDVWMRQARSEWEELPKDQELQSREKHAYAVHNVLVVRLGRVQQGLQHPSAQ